MNKKVIAIVLVVAIAITGVFAAQTSGTSKKDGFSLGLYAGTNSGLALKYGMGKFDIQGGVSFSALASSLSVEAGAYYDFYDWNVTNDKLNPQYINLTAGVAAGLNVGGSALALDVFGIVGAEYTFPKVPLTLFTKFGIGPAIVFSDSVGVHFSGYGVLGCLYNF